jgi:hypothetical protein
MGWTLEVILYVKQFRLFWLIKLFYLDRNFYFSERLLFLIRTILFVGFLLRHKGFKPERLHIESSIALK